MGPVQGKARQASSGPALSVPGCSHPEARRCELLSGEARGGCGSRRFSGACFSAGCDPRHSLATTGVAEQPHSGAMLWQ